MIKSLHLERPLSSKLMDTRPTWECGTARLQRVFSLPFTARLAKCHNVIMVYFFCPIFIIFLLFLVFYFFSHHRGFLRSVFSFIYFHSHFLAPLETLCSFLLFLFFLAPSLEFQADHFLADFLSRQTLPQSPPPRLRIPPIAGDSLALHTDLSLTPPLVRSRIT